MYLLHANESLFGLSGTQR